MRVLFRNLKEKKRETRAKGKIIIMKRDNYYFKNNFNFDIIIIIIKSILL